MAFPANPHRRIAAACAALAVVVGMVALLLVGLRVNFSAAPAAVLQAIAFTPDSPPPKPQPKPKPAPRRPTPDPGGAAPSAPPPAPPPPRIVILPPQVATVPVPATGNGPPGPGGNGTGGSGFGNGSGSGDGSGNGGIAAPARQIAGNLSPRDLPAGTIPPGGQLSVGVAYIVGTDGRVHDCSVPHSSGMAEIDARVCELLVKRFRYRPARAADGAPVASPVRETHSWARKPAD